MNFGELNNPKTKIIILGVLILTFIVLFFFYRRDKVKDISLENIKTETTFKTFTPEELKKTLPIGIDSIANLFGIKKEWIKENIQPVSKQTLKNKQTKKPEQQTFFPPNLWFSKEISLPKDISVAEINYEIKNFLTAYDFDCSGIEEPRTGNVLLGLYNNKDSSRKTLAQINFIYNDKIKRDAADICIILDKVEKIPIPNLEKLMNYPDNFSVILPDILDKIDAQVVVLDSKREYLLYLDIGDNDNLLAEFKPEMKEKEWKDKVRNISYEYDKTAGVIMNNPKKIYPLEQDIISEFPKYKIKAFRDSVLIKFNTEEKDKNKINLFFNDITTRTQKGARSMIYLVNFTFEEFNYFRDESFRLKRKGFKFFKFSDLINRRLKNAEPEIKPEIVG